jgi:PBP1b-binding outer membrane lipoprotein LpoB
MKKILVVSFIFLGLFINGCSKPKVVDKSYYERANSASSESLKSLDRDTK